MDRRDLIDRLDIARKYIDAGKPTDARDALTAIIRALTIPPAENGNHVIGVPPRVARMRGV